MTSISNNVHLFITSKNSDDKATVYIDLPSDTLSTSENQGIKLNVLNFTFNNEIDNCIHNVNCEFEIITEVDTHFFQITEGCHSVFSLKDYLNILLVNYIKISYDKISNKYAFKNIYNSGPAASGPAASNIKLKCINSAQFFGLENDTEYNLNKDEMILSTKKLNMVYRRDIIIKTEGLSYEVQNLENFGFVNKFQNSSMLFFISRQDVEPYKEVIYKNEDGGDNFSYNLYDKNITRICLKLIDENDDEYDDESIDWSMTLCFTIYEKERKESLMALIKISDYLKQINVICLMVLEYFSII
jgi:hypothetical protein